MIVAAISYLGRFWTRDRSFRRRRSLLQDPVRISFNQIPFFSACTGKSSHPFFISAEFSGRTFIDDVSVVQHISAVDNFDRGANILFDQQYRNSLCSC